MKNYKIVVSDLDGTLLNSKKEITPEVEELVLSLSENNIFFVPATGRTFHAVPENVANLKGVEYIITSNGACINKIGENKPIYSCYLEHNTVMEVLEIGRKNKVIVEIFAHGNAYCEKNAMDNLEDYGLTEIQIKYLRQTRLPIESAVDFAIENKGEIENINILFKDLKLRETICTYLKKKDFAAITSSTTFNLEVTNKLATKGNAVNNLCNLL
ncbi:MAG: HAD-IIB family hydrolase, partial [Anaerotignaceae bacterium]